MTESDVINPKSQPECITQPYIKEIHFRSKTKNKYIFLILPIIK